MSDNPSKLFHGLSGKMNLKQLIVLLYEKGYISDYEEDFRIGYKGFDSKQFFSQFLIKFEDDEKWIIQSSTSIRSDRINIQQWRSFHIKRIRKDITKSIVVYSDDISKEERNTAIFYYDKILNEEIYSSIDNVISQTEFYLMVEDKYLKNREGGQQTAIRGLNFEQQIEVILNNEKNFSKWINNDSLETGLFYHYFDKIIDFIGVKSENTKEIKATTKIPSLPSGGQPKTDVLLVITFKDGSCKNYTFSLKRTSFDWVSVHEYPIDKFIKVLDIKDYILIDTLKKLQIAGGMKALGKDLTRYLENELPSYNRQLSYWVYGGVGGDGDPDTQWANNIITYQNDDKEFKIYSLDNYVNKVLTNNEGHFGTPFRWTYPSKGKGKRIQLKGKII